MWYSSGEPCSWRSSQKGHQCPSHCSHMWQFWHVWIIHDSPMAAFRETQALSKLACKFPTDVAHEDHPPRLCKVFPMQPWSSNAESLSNCKHKLHVYLLHYFKSKWTLQNSFQWSYLFKELTSTGSLLGQTIPGRTDRRVWTTCSNQTDNARRDAFCSFHLPGLWEQRLLDAQSSGVCCIITREHVGRRGRTGLLLHSCAPQSLLREYWAVVSLCLLLELVYREKEASLEMHIKTEPSKCGGFSLPECFSVGLHAQVSATWALCVWCCLQWGC